MALSYTRALEIMRACFPSWTDIRKRTNKSVGGGLLRAYAKEYDGIQDAIIDYQKLFFLLNYIGHEDEYVDYLQTALIGAYDVADIKIDSIDCEATEDTDDFLDNRSTKCLYESPYLLFHKSILPEGTDEITYTISNAYTYKVKTSKRAIWNIFDEFALFAGLKRYENETNKQLEKRTLEVFKEFPNGSEQGLKNAIKMCLAGEENITDEDINIVKFDKNNIDISDAESATIYEMFASLNRDMFRNKIWGQDTWEHSFQKTDYIPHAWDKPMSVEQDGVGYNDSLKVDFLSNLDTSDSTDITVSAYKQTVQAVREYIAHHNVETSVAMQLARYNETATPTKFQYKIHAYDTLEIDPTLIYIKTSRQISGENTFYIEDLADRLDGVTAIPQNKLNANTHYQLIFRSRDYYADMRINKCQLSDGNKSRNLLSEHDEFVFKNGSLVNKSVAAHVTNTSGLVKSTNVENVSNGMTVGLDDACGIFGIDVTGMSNNAIVYDIECNEVDITDTSYVKPQGGFELQSDRRHIVATTTSSIPNIEFQMTCNSYSFNFDAANDPSKQGSIIVTTIIDGVMTTDTYMAATTIRQMFEKQKNVHVIIQKNGQNPVSVSNFKASSYKAELYLENGHIIETPEYKMLPEYTGSNILYLKVTPTTSSYPIVKYIHIGQPTGDTRYIVDIDTTGMKDPKLDIDTNCLITRNTFDASGKTTDTIGDYSTKTIYKNNTTEDGYIIINTDDFVSINGSDPAMHKKYKNGVNTYITLAPGESIRTIRINGTVSHTLSNDTLASYIYKDGNSTDMKSYITNVDGMVIVKNTKTGEVKKVNIKRSQFNGLADKFEVTGMSNESRAEFVMADGSILYGSIMATSFEVLNFRLNTAKEYVAYNDVYMTEDKKSGIEIVNTFAPLMSMSSLKYYMLEVPAGVTGTAVFDKTGQPWSLGVNTITVTTSLTSEMLKYNLEITHVNNRYILANNIPLNTSYIINGISQELARFIITVEDGMSISYEDENYEEDLPVLNTRIAKLTYANVSNLAVDGVNSSKYSVMAPEGVIVMNDNSYNGRNIHVSYTFKRPVSITYSDWHKIYKLVSYDIEAYSLIGTKQFHNLKDGDTEQLTFSETPARIITKCSNNSFQSTVQNNILKVIQIAADNKLAVHNGYIYDSGREYYYFNDRYIDMDNRNEDIEMHEVTRQEDELLFHMRSTNYLPYSDMYSTKLSKLCAIDLTKRTPKNISEFNHYTACESYSTWYGENMSMSLTAGANGLGIRFNSQDGKIGYAVTNITDYIKQDNILSVVVNGDVSVGLVQEVHVNNLPFAKSTCVREDDVEPFSVNGRYQYMILDKPRQEETKYYLHISGTEGIIDDLISMPYISIEDMKGSHTKNITKLNYSAVQEQTIPDHVYELEFDRCGSIFEDLVYDNMTKELSVSNTIEYGLTKMYSCDISRCMLENAELNKNTIKFTRNNASAETERVYIKSKSSVYALHIKVNDIFGGKYAGFSIDVYGSGSYDDYYSLIAHVDNNNIVTVPARKILGYIYIVVKGQKGQIINNIEIYAQYAERGIRELISTPKDSGTYISKVYDIGSVGNYCFDGADMDVNGQGSVSLYVRGARDNLNDIVFTDWKKYNSDVVKNLTDVEFDNYRYFQFKTIISSNINIKINSFNMKAIS